MPEWIWTCDAIDFEIEHVVSSGVESGGIEYEAKADVSNAAFSWAA